MHRIIFFIILTTLFFPPWAKAATLARLDSFVAAFESEEQERRRLFLAELVVGVDPTLVNKEIRESARQELAEEKAAGREDGEADHHGHGHDKDGGDALRAEYLAFLRQMPEADLALADALGETAIFKAARIGIASGVAILIEKGAKIAGHDRDGRSVLAATCNPEILEILEKAGASPGSAAERYHVGRCRNQVALVAMAAEEGYQPAMADMGARFAAQFEQAATAGDNEAYCNLGLAREMMGDPAAALAAYDKGLLAGDQALCRQRKEKLLATTPGLKNIRE